MRSLLIGCGSSRAKKLHLAGMPHGWDGEVVTLDIDRAHGPNVAWDLNLLPLPFADESFDEIHAYEVLEHCGRQGDAAFFFRQFNDFYRLLKPAGTFAASVPSLSSEWLWADPSHTRVIAPGTLIFLDRVEYAQVGTTSMSDYRSIYVGDFVRSFMDHKGESFWFALRAVKPARATPPLEEVMP